MPGTAPVYDPEQEADAKHRRTPEEMPAPPNEPGVNDEDFADFERRLAGPSATAEDLPEKHPDRDKLATPDQLADSEEAADKEPSAEPGLYSGDEQPGRLRGLVAGRKRNPQKSRRNKILLAAGGAGGIGLVIGLFILLTFFKIPHFAQILTASGYARLDTILQDRATQAIYDASLVEGEGSVPIQGRSLFDRLRGINPDADLAALGREGKIKFQFGDEKKGFLGRKSADFKGVQIGDKNISMDGITKELGFGDSYADLGKVSDLGKRARVRYEFTERIKASVNSDFALERRYVRSNAFKAIADAEGFSFKRWRQKARDFIGEDPETAYAKDVAEAREQVSGTSDVKKTGFDEVDKTDEKVKETKAFQDYIKENPEGTLEDFIAKVAKENLGTAEQIRGVAETVGQVTVLMSVACIINQGLQYKPDVERNNYDQAEREGLQLAAAGAQVKHGDVSGEAVQAETKRLEHAELSAAYQYDTGNKTPSVPANFASPSVKTNFDNKFVDLIHTLTSPTTLAAGPVKSLLGAIPGIGDLTNAASDTIDQKFCEALLSPAGMVIATGAEVFAQAVIAALSEGAGTEGSEGLAAIANKEFVAELVKSLVKTSGDLVSVDSLKAVAALGILDMAMQYLSLYLSNQTFSGGETKAAYYERARTGTALVQDHSLRMSMYGAPMSLDQLKKVEDRAHKETISYYNNQSLFARYFSFNNPFSLVSSMTASVPSSLASVGDWLQHAVSSLGSLFSPNNLFKPAFALMGHSYADQLQSYDPNEGIQAWGYTEDEINKLKYDPSYSLEQNEKIIKPLVDKIDKQYGKCFTTTSQYDADKLVDDGTCSSDKLQQEEVFRYRVYKGLDSYVVDELTTGLSTP